MFESGNCLISDRFDKNCGFIPINNLCSVSPDGVALRVNDGNGLCVEVDHTIAARMVARGIPPSQWEHAYTVLSEQGIFESGCAHFGMHTGPPGPNGGVQGIVRVHQLPPQRMVTETEVLQQVANAIPLARQIRSDYLFRNGLQFG